MKKPHSFSLSILLMGLTTACQTPHPTCEDVVCETYVHRYGVPLAAEEWSSRGQSGQVVAMRKDGVVVATNYDAGVLHGDCTYTFPYRDTIQRREIFDQGNVVRELFYYPSGLPEREITYQSPTLSIAYP